MTAHVDQRSSAEKTLMRQFGEGKMVSSPRRVDAFDRFVERGLPTRRLESWHYTDLRAAMRDAAPLAPAPDSDAIERARQMIAGRRRLASARVVLLDGRLVAELCDQLPPGASISQEELSLADVDDAMMALNEAMSVEAYALTVADGAIIEGPIEIVHIATARDARSLYTRGAILLGVRARASFFESYVGGGPGVQRNSSTVLILAEGACAKHVAIIEDAPGLHIESQIGQLGVGAKLNAFALVAGGSLTRRQLFHRLIGRDANIILGGLTLLDGARRADTTLQVVHVAEAGTSREYYRAIVDEEAVGTFQGKVIVESAAQKTDGAMKSQAVLLSQHAQMNAKPELEIFADDVVCGHGATFGSLDPEQLFYMMARGIGRSEAESMLLEAFGEEAIARIEDDVLAEALRVSLRAWLAWGRVARTEGKGAAALMEPAS